MSKGPCDAEHPTFIPMYTPTTLQAPRGHMTRPQTYAIGHKVNSLLFEPSLSTCETWLLPHAWTLPILRYNRDDHGESKDQGQAWKRRRKKSQLLQDPDIRAQPGHPARPRKSGALHRMHPKLKPVRPNIRLEARRSGSSRAAGHPAPARTSGACLHTVNGPRAHVSPLSLTPSWANTTYRPPTPPS